MYGVISHANFGRTRSRTLCWRVPGYGNEKSDWDCPDLELDLHGQAFADDLPYLSPSDI